MPPAPGYNFEDVKRASAAGGVFTQVFGGLSGVTRQDFPNFVRQLMSGDINGQPIRFVGKSPAGGTPDLRVVVWFNPAQDRSTITNLCTYHGAVDVNPDAQRAEVLMALCSGTTRLSSASGLFFFFGVDPSEQNRFRNMITSVTASLFPLRIDREDREFERWS